MDINKLFNQYCTNLYRVGKYAFTDKEDAQKYLEAHLKYELKGYSHGLIHIPLVRAEGDYDYDEEDFVNEMAEYEKISYDKDEFDDLWDAYYYEDPAMSNEDRSEIEKWIEQYNTLVKEIGEVLDSTNVSISYSWNPKRTNNYNFIITGTKSEVEQLYWAMYGDQA